MKKNIIIVLAIVLSISALSLAACAPGNGESSSGDDSIGLEVGKFAPDFTLDLRGGGTVKLSELRGRPTLVNFYTTWCQPCQTEFPEIQKVADKYGDKIHVLGISAAETVQTVNEFFDNYPDLVYPMAFDPNGQTSIAYNIDVIPQTWILNADGLIVDYIEGGVDEARFSRGLDKALGGAS